MKVVVDEEKCVAAGQCVSDLMAWSGSFLKHQF
ncbi:ferredoxin [Streptomyces sp. NPDC006602]